MSSCIIRIASISFKSLSGPRQGELRGAEAPRAFERPEAFFHLHLQFYIKMSRRKSLSRASAHLKKAQKASKSLKRLHLELQRGARRVPRVQTSSSEPTGAHRTCGHTHMEHVPAWCTCPRLRRKSFLFRCFLSYFFCLRLSEIEV